METVRVDASKSYDIKIGNGILHSAGSLIQQASPQAKKLALISDSTVNSLYGDIVQESLENEGYSVIKYVFPAGEQSKNTDTLVEILNFLAENSITRSDMIIALGGGVVGDIAGFAAAVYLRGIKFVQIPTTLLAMVDSSVGGKTAVNLTSGKNLAGAFYQPELVLCDIDVLSTLPSHVFSDGCAEIIKYGLICDDVLFRFCLDDNIANNLEYVIKTCVEIKAEIVNTDEFDTGRRRLLNLGHTIGHAIEKCSNYTIHHGAAVAIGMMAVAKGAFACGLCHNDLSPIICRALEKYSLPLTAGFSAQELYSVTLSDKKLQGGTLTLVVPAEIGKSMLMDIPCEAMLKIIEKGLSA